MLVPARAIMMIPTIADAMRTKIPSGISNSGSISPAFFFLINCRPLDFKERMVRQLLLSDVTKFPCFLAFLAYFLIEVNRM